MPIEKQQPSFINQFAQGVTSKGSERVKAIPERASSAEVRVLSSLNIANMTNMTNRMAESHLGKEELGSGRSRKKSVRFSEQSLEVV